VIVSPLVMIWPGFQEAVLAGADDSVLRRQRHIRAYS